MKKQLIDFYLDWVNNYLTTAKMAEHYGLNEGNCIALINMGKRYLEEDVRNVKGSLDWSKVKGNK
jgi:hypothetical protein